MHLDYQSSQRLVFTAIKRITPWNPNMVNRSCVECGCKSDFQLRPYLAVQHRHTCRAPGVPVICRQKPQSISQIDGLSRPPAESFVLPSTSNLRRVCRSMHGDALTVRFRQVQPEDSGKKSISDVTCFAESGRCLNHCYSVRSSAHQSVDAATMFSRPRPMDIKACTSASSRSVHHRKQHLFRDIVLPDRRSLSTDTK